jgi:phosphate transport system ATP-binding protein
MSETHSANGAVAEGSRAKGMTAEAVTAWYGSHLAIEKVNLTFEPNVVTALIGPSGCGKSTLLRCLNRMHEEIPGARTAGRILFGDEDILGPGVDTVVVRKHIGMVFQKPNPFPMMTIYDNVISGYRLSNSRLDRAAADMIVEKSLRQAALWDEVKDKLKQSGASLSGGQQQRLCIARTVAMQPAVVLMDEPCSALDPVATYKIEELMSDLARDYTIIIVTHNMQQASRVSEYTAFMLAAEDRTGRLVEFAPTREMFANPKDKRTEDYLTGRFG